ncbi:MAG: dihydrofolate reductase [Bacteroidetes bacterium]|nr:dihydrofolate reductase [Bacteroidota bacterium]
MRKIIVSEHISADGFMAGENGEMDWIRFDEALFEFVGQFTAAADTALYGRKTWEMMDAYWPTAADKPGASKHAVGHSAWYNSVDKIVLSNTMQGEQRMKTNFLGGDIRSAITALKNKPGKNILMFGSATAAHTLMQYQLIDEYWLFVNPVLLGKGIRLFEGLESKVDLLAKETKSFGCSVTALHFTILQ